MPLISRFFWRKLPLILPVLALVLCGLPGPDAVFAAETVSYDFESRPDKAWSPRGRMELAEGQALGPFNSRHKEAPRRAKLKIGKELAGKPLTLRFDLLLLGQWDSGGDLADRFEVDYGGKRVLLVNKFPCKLPPEAELMPENAPNAARVFNRWLAVCRLPQVVTLPPAEEGDTIVFKGTCSGRRSEFWALDNVSLSTP
jgi:hypothetical protein